MDFSQDSQAGDWDIDNDDGSGSLVSFGELVKVINIASTQQIKHFVSINFEIFTSNSLTWLK